ncbi:MAG: alpha/beta hydrolase, partial [Myxococcota bacterium]
MKYDRQGFVEAKDGTRLFFGVAGNTASERAPVVLCDGIGCDGFVWRYLHPHLADERLVVHWHYRGHGRSGAPPSSRTMTIETLAEDLQVLIEHLGLERAVLAGHSMGTLVALEWERQHRTQCEGALLLCGSAGRITHTFRGTDALSELLPGLLGVVARHSGMVRAVWGRVPPSFAYRLAKLSGEIDPATLRSDDFSRYWEHVSHMDPDVFLHMLRAAGDYNAAEHLDELSAPKLVVAAENDTFTPPEHATALAAALPDAELFHIRGGSHAAPV